MPEDNTIVTDKNAGQGATLPPDIKATRREQIYQLLQSDKRITDLPQDYNEFDRHMRNPKIARNIYDY